MILFLDSENTTWNTGSPFDPRNFNVCISAATEGSVRVFFDVVANPQPFKELFDKSTTLVGFNLKYDLHWLRKLGFDYRGKDLYCCQVAEFFLGRQSPKYPSLNETAAKYHLGTKVDKIAQYWDEKINTHELPRAELEEYALQDALLTQNIYLKQQELIKPHQRVLLKLQMLDLEVLTDIEWNGLHFDPGVIEEKQKEIEARIDKIQKELDLFHSVPNFNWASGDHLSALLYGGTITEKRKVPDGVYKSGAKAGQQKFKAEYVEHHLPRLYKPVKGSELKKEGFWSTSEEYLRKLSDKRGLVTGILEISKLQTMNNTFVHGLAKKHAENMWEPNYIHGQYNQVVAATGRLSSSNPNMQNLSGDVLNIFDSRF